MSAHCFDLRGEKFGKLTPLEIDRTRMNEYKARTFWICECDCGNIKSVAYHGLAYGYTTSCGCAWKKAGEKKEMLEVIENKMRELEERIEVNTDLRDKLKDKELQFKYELEIQLDKCALESLKDLIDEIGIQLFLHEIHKDIKELFEC